MTQAGSVYGEALYTLALEEGLTEKLLAELTATEKEMKDHFHK